MTIGGVGSSVPRGKPTLISGRVSGTALREVQLCASGDLRSFHRREGLEQGLGRAGLDLGSLGGQRVRVHSGQTLRLLPPGAFQVPVFPQCRVQLQAG